ncbi:type VI secretion system baseplate subunit TssG [Paracandidimonas soli]|uniref:Type VI secretion system protein ImpH n=1 Tax=Paracandidimonas soli TaxID=1917182 RepID=A0A4R3URI1_9BURK|nr:type VI secretion system baseplate subunit TssG [Paracandidimonas soli]TCU93008.1 type VI secretion system protein ImpH [Paracandidimonas soli]
MDDLFWSDAQAQPYRYDLFHLLRWVEARSGMQGQLGKARRAREEPVRVRQAPSMAFAPATIAGVRKPEEGRAAQVSIYSFGLFGPNGPLPLHMTEYVHQRVHHHRDNAFSAFADLFHQRLILLFYRAWADAQPVVDLDRMQQHFTRYVASMINMGAEAPSAARKGPGLHSRLYMTPHLARQTRNAEGLEHILSSYLGARVRLFLYMPGWLRLEPDACTRLGVSGRLGQDTVLGKKVRDVQHRFRLCIGPLSLEDYLDLLPGKRRMRDIQEWVRLYAGLEYAWDVLLVLAADQVPGVRLGAIASGALGRSSWLGSWRREKGDAADFIKTYSEPDGDYV